MTSRVFITRMVKASYALLIGMVAGLNFSQEAVAGQSCFANSMRATNVSPSNFTLTGGRDTLANGGYLTGWFTGQMSFSSGCSSGPGYSEYFVSNFPPSTVTTADGYKVFPTSNPSIGYVVYAADTQGGAVKLSTSAVKLRSEGSMGKSWWSTVNTQIRFVQLTPLAPGTYIIDPNTDAIRMSIDVYAPLDAWYGTKNSGYNGFTVTVNTQTCTIDAGTIDQTVNLPMAPLAKISKASAVYGATPFTLSVTGCDKSIKLNATLTDVNNTSSTGKILTNTGDATGVGVQILRSGTPVSFGPQSSVTGNTNQFYIGTGQTDYSIPLVAQYVNTGTVKAGSVQAQAWVTFSYQ